MSGYKDYKGQSVGLARIMAESPYSDGDTALLIKNFYLDQRGFLDSTYRVMDFIPYEWNYNQAPFPFQSVSTLSGKQSGVYAMGLCTKDGEYTDILFLTKDGVMRYCPWTRPVATMTATTTNNARYGLCEQYYYSYSSDRASVKPQKNPIFPPQILSYGNRMYFTFCDGGGTWVWDGKRVRPFGYTQKPSPPLATGPERAGPDNDDANQGGFSHRGRIGSTESTFVSNAVTGALVAGGIDNSIYRYAVVFENTDGAYSQTSSDGPKVSVEFETASVDATTGTFTPVERLQKKFRVHDIPKGPPGTVARILLRTYNLLRLPNNSVGEYRFLHRIANNSSVEYIDDIPDGELGSAWSNRAGTPVGCNLITHFAGSIFLLNNSAYPYRVWFSEQEQSGPIPESFMELHFLDVFPNTGPITATAIANLADTRKQFLLVFKNNCTHYITGAYPNWEVGTLHNNAGCAGPNLVQTLPDNSLVWYGTGTFWMLRAGKIRDIGTPIRKLLSTINESASRLGASWVDIEYREAIFALPTDESVQNNLQFIYDYTNEGFRLREDVVINCVLNLPEERCTLIAGFAKVYRGGVYYRFDSDFNPTETERPFGLYDESNVYVYHRSYPLCVKQNRVSTYQTGWMSFSGLGPRLHQSDRATQVILTQHERSDKQGYVSVYKDWNIDDSLVIHGIKHFRQFEDTLGTTTGIPVLSQTPEDDKTSNYGTSLFNTGMFTPTVGSGSFAESKRNTVWRTERVYTQKLAVEIESHSVHSIKIETIDPMGLYNIDVYGPNVSGPGTRNPTLDP
tara:strand:- start:6816 stop:9194 length:2379 start_codon:yes stop_codon:yes gene_type:complete